METREELAARLAQMLNEECGAKGFILFVWEPGDTRGAITYSSNEPRREVIIKFLHEWIARNKS